jgi:hypothetical protein
MFCSETSINRPWINIEFGATWMLGTPVIPLCLPGLPVDELPFQFADMKVCELGNEKSCIELLERILDRVNARFPYVLSRSEVARQGKQIFSGVADAIKARGVFFVDAPPKKRATVWICGSYTDLTSRELSNCNEISVAL